MLLSGVHLDYMLLGVSTAYTILLVISASKEPVLEVIVNETVRQRLFCHNIRDPIIGEK